MLAYLLQYHNASGGTSTQYIGNVRSEAEAMRCATPFVRANFIAAFRCGVIA